MLIIGVEPELWAGVVAAGDGDVCEAVGLTEMDGKGLRLTRCGYCVL